VRRAEASVRERDRLKPLTLKHINLLIRNFRYYHRAQRHGSVRERHRQSCRTLQVSMRERRGGVQGVRNQGDFGGADKYSLRNQGDFTTDQIKETGNQVLGAEPGFTAH
jgi:hypothetical protein